MDNCTLADDARGWLYALTDDSLHLWDRHRLRTARRFFSEKGKRNRGIRERRAIAKISKPHRRVQTSPTSLISRWKQKKRLPYVTERRARVLFPSLWKLVAEKTRGLPAGILRKAQFAYLVDERDAYAMMTMSYRWFAHLSRETLTVRPLHLEREWDARAVIEENRDSHEREWRTARLLDLNIDRTVIPHYRSWHMNYSIAPVGNHSRLSFDNINNISYAYL